VRQPIPRLVFSTRSPSPKSGPDFVREVVAESPGIAAEVRAEFSRRADIAGSVMQRQLNRPVYMFSPIALNAWLLCRAVSLGLYRKGSNQLLVHGLILAEEHLDALDANPLLLDLPEIASASGIVFADEHPGRERDLPPFPFDDDVAALCRRRNCERLEQLARLLDRASFAAAYDALVGRLRVGVTTPEPLPFLVEAYLLHFHPDDRQELSFHTFYSHNRPLDYRLLLLAPEDAQAVREQFHDLLLLDMTEPSPVAPSLGCLAARLRQLSVERFLSTVESNRLTYWSRRFLPPLSRDDASLCLRAGLGEPTTGKEARRLQELGTRGQRSVRYWISSLSRTWQDDTEEFPRRLSELASAENPLTMQEIAPLFETPPLGLDERWCLLALFAREEVLRLGEDWKSARRRALQTLMPAEVFEAFLHTLRPDQASKAEMILLDYAIENLAHEIAPPQGPPYWEMLLAWMGRRRPIDQALLYRVETALALQQKQGKGDAALDAWGRLQTILYEAGQQEEALRLFFSRSLPLRKGPDTLEKAKSAISWWLENGTAHDAAVAPFLGGRLVAELTLTLLGDWFAKRTPGTEERAFRRVSAILASMEELPISAGAGCGHLLAPLALSSDRKWVGEALDRCLRALTKARDSEREAFIGAALDGAASQLIPALSSCDVTDLPRLLQAVAALLEARNRNRATAAADAVLLDLAVRGRILAQEARAYRRADDAVTLFDRHWLAFLRTARLVEYLLEVETAPSPERFGRLHEWLELLQDELATAKLHHAESDPRFGFFIRLAWWRWSVSQGRPDHSTLCAKLRLAQTWGRIPASTAWFHQLIKEMVPGTLQERALALVTIRPHPPLFRLLRVRA
jgi:hypothetical protein